MTTFENKCGILAELWINYRYDQDFAEFISMNDLGLPLAYAIDSGIVDKTDLAVKFIEETFDLFLAGFEYEEDSGWNSLDEIFSQAEWMPPPENEV